MISNIALSSSRSPGMSRSSFLRLMGAGALGVLSSSVLTACGDSDEGSGSGPVEFTSYALTPGEGEAVNDALAAIMKAYQEQTGVAVTPNPLPFKDVLQQVILKSNGNNISGVVHVSGAWIPALATAGAIAKIDSLVKPDVFTDAALRTGMFDGARYGLPWNVSALGIVANQEMLTQVGSDQLPSNVEDFEALLVELKKANGGDFIPYAVTTAVAGMDIVPWLLTFGCPVIEDGAVTLGDDASVEAVTWLAGLQAKGLIAPDLDRAHSRTLFALKRTAMYEDDNGAVESIVEQSSDKDIASKMVPATRPAPSGGTSTNLFGSKSLAVISNGRTDAVDDFAVYLATNDDSLHKMFDSYGQIPGTTEAVNSDWYSADTFVSQWTKTITDASVTSPLWGYSTAAQMQQALYEQVSAALHGQTDPKEALANAKSQITPLLT